MNRYHVNWLYGELSKWEKSEIVSDEVTLKIKAYYKEQEEKETALIQKRAEEEKAKKLELVKKLPLIFSSIAATLIAAGIISLIAFNWHLISRSIKTFGAFFIAIVPGISYFLCAKYKRNFTNIGKEFLSLLWSLLTGGMIEFIIQIYKIPSNIELTLFTWLLVTVLILFATETAATFFFSIVLLISTVLSSQSSDFASTAVFYLVMAALAFAAGKNKVRQYVLTGTFFLLLGFVLEKCLPGLWISSYTCALSTLMFVGLKRKDKVFTYGALAGILVLLGMLSAPYFWEDIGWKNFRNDSSHNAVTAIADYVVFAFLFLASVGLPLLDAKTSKKISLNNSVALLPLFSVAFYILCSERPEASIYSATFVYLVIAVYTLLGALFLQSNLFYIAFGILAALGFYCTKENCTLYLVSMTFLLWQILKTRNVKFSHPAKWNYPVLVALSIISYLLFISKLHTEECGARDLVSFYIFVCTNIAAFIVFSSINIRHIDLKKIKEIAKETVPILLINLSIVAIITLKEFIGDYQNEVFGFILLFIAASTFVFWKIEGKNHLLIFPAILYFHTIWIIESDSYPIMFMIYLAIAFASNYGKPKVKNIALLLFAFLTLVQIPMGSVPFLSEGSSTVAHIFAILSIGFMTFIGMLLPCWQFYKSKTLPQIGINLIALRAIANLLLITAFDFHVNAIFNSVTYYMVIFIFVLQEIAAAYKEMSLKKMNLFAVYFFVLVLKYFFMQPVSLIARGCIFIISGVIVMILNLAFSKKLKAKENTKDEN